MEVIQVQPRDSYLHYVVVSTKPMTIHWSFKTKRHNINFGIYKRQLEDDNDDALFSPTSDQPHPTAPHQSALLYVVKSAATAKLLEQGLTEIVPIQQTNSSRANVEGSLIATDPGNYVLVFDNTFSKNTAKVVTLSVTLSEVPETLPSSTDTKTPTIDDPSYLVNGNDSYELTGWLLKKRRKKMQGWAKRWCRLSSQGVLSYAFSPTSVTRGQLPIPSAIITHQPNTLSFHIQSSSSLSSSRPDDDDDDDDNNDHHYELKALTMDDYTHWATHLKRLSTQAVQRQLDRFDTWRLARQSHHLTNLVRGQAREDVARGLQASQLVKEKLQCLDQWIQEQQHQDDDDNDDGNHRPGGSSSEWMAGLVALKQEVDAAVQHQDQLWHVVQDTVWQADPFGLHKAFANVTLDGETGSGGGGARQWKSIERSCSVDSAVTDGGDDNDGIDGNVNKNQNDDQDNNDATPHPSSSSSSKSSWMRDYPTNPHRRSQLPSVAVGEVSSALSIFRKNVGKDLSTLMLPISMNEPINLLQRACEELEYAHLLEKAAHMETPLERLMYVTVFAISSYASSQYKTERKPFNPLMNETYENIRPDKGFRFVAEKVCHHPLTIAAHAESDHYTFWQCTKAKSKFWGKSMELITEGVYHVQLEGHDDHYTYSKPSSWIRNMLAGEKYIEHAGEMKIVNQTTGDYAVVTFKEGSGGGIFGTPTKRNDVVAQFYPAKSSHGKKQARARRVVGKWSDTLSEELEMKKMGPGGRQLSILWTANLPDVEDYVSHYGFTRFCVEMNEITDIEKHHLPITDTRYRPDQRLYELGFVDEADAKKKQIEQKQRDRRNAFELAGLPWKARWFTLQEDPYAEPGFATPDTEERQSWIFNHQYWETRKSGNWPEDMFELW